MDAPRYVHVLPRAASPFQAETHQAHSRRSGLRERRRASAPSPGPGGHGGRTQGRGFPGGAAGGPARRASQGAGPRDRPRVGPGDRAPRRGPGPGLPPERHKARGVGTSTGARPPHPSRCHRHPGRPCSRRRRPQGTGGARGPFWARLPHAQQPAPRSLSLGRPHPAPRRLAGLDPPGERGRGGPPAPAPTRLPSRGAEERGRGRWHRRDASEATVTFQNHN